MGSSDVDGGSDSNLADGGVIEAGTGKNGWSFSLTAREDNTEALEDLEQALVGAVKAGDKPGVDQILKALLPNGIVGGTQQATVSRIIWRAVLEDFGKPTNSLNGVDGEQADGVRKGLIPIEALDFGYVDDINGRTTLHEVRFFPLNNDPSPRSFPFFFGGNFFPLTLPPPSYTGSKRRSRRAGDIMSISWSTDSPGGRLRSTTTSLRRHQGPLGSRPPLDFFRSRPNNSRFGWL